MASRNFPTSFSGIRIPPANAKTVYSLLLSYAWHNNLCFPGQERLAALALTRLVPGLRLFDIKCAWFNEHEYCEFFPRTLFAR